jgi:type IV pilus assembly protein PilV
MRKHSTLPPISAQQGIALVEAMIAILIFSIGVLGIVGMQANMVKNTSESKNRADAGYIAQQYIGMLWTNSDNLPGPSVTDISAQLPGGTVTITPQSDRAYQITVSWTQPGEPQHSFTTFANIVGEGVKP